ncbi:uncharacterized protein B0I36DRAFT_359602 [Microdochium trichocladiopsis]|uniref:Uncharacterized protein n=1 Tax=Microdochium trichocladiopsis TaxID=1682393 RepID=A0A9P9BSK3_9PEZI|nr:uncharacterized protein B0I36DRAFT_359602 [Microdochium trichocladiopsis]KAH7037990.1 hypothetical protein B0I36DRAFT_359602 [Microdochium trichocladiopsis]
MPPPSSTTCQGFAHPLVLLVRSSLHASATSQCFTQNAWVQSRTLTRRSSTRFASSKSRGGHNATRKPSPVPPTLTPAISPTSPSTSTSTAPRPASRAPPAAAAAAGTATESAVGPHVGYAQLLARKTSATTLYEGAAKRVFLFSSYAAGITLFGGATINSIVNVFDLPQGVPEWVAFPFGFVSVMMAVLGARFAMTPAGVVRSIKVLPASSASAAVSSGKVMPKSMPPTITTTTAAAARPQLEVLVRRTTPIPGLPLRRIVCEPHEIVMKARMYNRPSAPPSREEQALAAAEEAARKKAELEYEKTHIMTAPFRHGWWAIKTFFASIRQGLTGEGFAPVEVKGVKYKLDITDGYALEEGRALDRIVQIDEDRTIAVLRGLRR